MSRCEQQAAHPYALTPRHCSTRPSSPQSVLASTGHLQPVVREQCKIARGAHKHAAG